MARQLGVAAIWVSNHGGRSMDSLKPNMEVLEDCILALRDFEAKNASKLLPAKMEVYYDSGIRYGEDIFKALAQGADFVFVGRPLLWGASVDGRDGCEKVLDILESELRLAMGLAGCTNVREVTREYLLTPQDRMIELLEKWKRGKKSLPKPRL